MVCESLSVAITVSKTKISLCIDMMRSKELNNEDGLTYSRSKKLIECLSECRNTKGENNKIVLYFSCFSKSCYNHVYVQISESKFSLLSISD